VKPVFQDKFGEKDGNCLEAAIASVLEIPLSAIPFFGNDDNRDWWNHQSDFLAKYGLVAFDVDPSGFGKEDKQRLGYHLINGKSPRIGALHSIVGYRGKPVHDPLPGGECKLRNVETYTLFVALLDDYVQEKK
jgi:hypothetical protein